MNAEDPDVHFREKVQKVPPSAYAAVCTHKTCCQSLWRLRCSGAFLEVVGALGPQRCLNQIPSMGQKAFAPRLPQGEWPPNPIPRGKIDITRMEGHRYTREYRGEESQRKQHNKEKKG